MWIMKPPTTIFQPSSSSSSSSSSYYYYYYCCACCFICSTNTSYASRDDFLPRKTQTQSSSLHLSFSKPSLIVRTQSNVRIERRKKPEPSCVVCNGTGRVDCHHCNGLGRTNHTDLAMLPKGEWPKWCKRCGGSGLGYCNRCLGTGEYRDIMGFHFIKARETNHSQDQTKDQIPEKPDLLPSQTLPE